MDEREEKIIDAAVRVFVRYGVRRTTMNDIASEAGIARQTLYNVYANKDEVLRAVIRLLNTRSVAAIEAGCAQSATLADQLDVLFQHMVVRAFELVNATPDAEDVISGFNDAGRDEIEAARKRYRVVIEAILQPYGEQIGASGLTSEQLSDVVHNAAQGFKYRAGSKKHLLELLRTLKILILRIANEAVDGQRR